MSTFNLASLRKSTLRRVWISSLVLIAIFAVRSPAVSPEVLNSVRKTKVLSIDRRNSQVIWKLRPGPNQVDADYVILEGNPWSMETEMREVLREWVRSGHGAIVELTTASFELLFDSDSFRSVDLTGMTCLIPASNHAILAGVKQTMLLSGFEVKDKKLSYTPLLKSDNGPERVYSVIAVDYGAGRVIVASNLRILYLCTNLNAPLDTQRFAINLDQWLAGFPVYGAPPSQKLFPTAASGSTGVITQSQDDGLILRNGDRLTGQVCNKSFTMKTSYATLTFDREKVDSIVLEGAGNNVDEMALRAGDKLSGVLQDTSIQIKLSSGGEAEVSRDKIKVIQIRRPADGNKKQE